MASPMRRSLTAGATAPPGLSITRSVMPCRVNMVDKVTTIGCMRSTATKKPLKAPESTPIPHAHRDHHEGRGSRILQRGGQRHVDQRNRRAGRQIEPAGNDDDGLADCRERQGGTTRCHLAEVVIREGDRADAGHNRQQQEEHGDCNQEAAVTGPAAAAPSTQSRRHRSWRRRSRSPSRRLLRFVSRAERSNENVFLGQLFPARNLGRHAAGIEHHHPIAEIDELGDLARVEQNGAAPAA